MFVVETALYTKTKGNHTGMARNKAWKDFLCLCSASPQKGICTCCVMLQ